MNTLLAIVPYIGQLNRPLYILLILIGLWLGLRRATLPGNAKIALWTAVAVPLLLWFAIMNMIGRTDVYQAMPLARPAAALLPPALWLLLLMRSKAIAAILDATPPSVLVGFQVFRVFGFVFLVLWAAGRAPATFALPAGIGDVMTGLLALPAAIYIQRRAPHWRVAGYALNTIGLTDFAIALSIAVFVAPAGTRYPLNMIATFAVPLYITLHGLSLWQLARTRTLPASGQAGIGDHSGAAAVMR